MKIERTQNNLKRFDYLNEGDVFECDSRIFIKVGIDLAVDLEDGLRASFALGDQVLPLSHAKVVV